MENAGDLKGDSPLTPPVDGVLKAPIIGRKRISQAWVTPPLTPPRLPLTEPLFVSSLWARNAALRFPTLANYNVIPQSGGGGAVPIRSIVWGPVRLHGVITCLTPRKHQTRAQHSWRTHNDCMQKTMHADYKQC